MKWLFAVLQKAQNTKSSLNFVSAPNADRSGSISGESRRDHLQCPLLLGAVDSELGAFGGHLPARTDILLHPRFGVEGVDLLQAQASDGSEKLGGLLL
jgi:hypothetical protein